MKATRLIITLTETGDLQLAGPVDNKALCYSLLELARDAVKDHNDKATTRIEAPSATDIMRLNGGHKV